MSFFKKFPKFPLLYLSVVLFCCQVVKIRHKKKRCITHAIFLNLWDKCEKFIIQRNQCLNTLRYNPCTTLACFMVCPCYPDAISMLPTWVLLPVSILLQHQMESSTGSKPSWFKNLAHNVVGIWWQFDTRLCRHSHQCFFSGIFVCSQSGNHPSKEDVDKMTIIPRKI